MTNQTYSMFSPRKLEVALVTREGLADVKARILASIDATTDMADIYLAIETELALARIFLEFPLKADLCVDVFQERQERYPANQIENRAGYYA